ncbi:MAG: hypothetical protein ABI700_19980 [Chloroflexota bacterium]
MNYYQTKMNAEAQRESLRHDSERQHLAAFAQEKRESTLTIRIEIKVGYLTNWRLKWNALRETKTTEDTLLCYDGKVTG